MKCGSCEARRKAQEQRAAAGAVKYEVVVNGVVKLETYDKARAIQQARVMKGKWRVKQPR